jgi:hypothetical protein
LFHDRTLVVPIEPMDDESGSGFILRLTERNCMSPTEMRRLIGAPAERPILRRHVRALALLSKVDPSRLMHKFPDQIRPVAGSGCNFWGHSLRFPTFIRWTRPQVCPLCVAQRQMCLGEWDFSCSSVCLEHDVALIDACPTCGLSLRWERPAIEWCKCRNYLGRVRTDAELPTGELREMQLIFRSFFRGEPLPPISFDWPFGDGMTLNGWLSMIEAFCSVSLSYKQPRHSAFSHLQSSSSTRALLSLAYQRVAMFSRPASRVDESLKCLIAEAPLMRLIRDGEVDADRVAAMNVYRFAVGEKALESVLRGTRRGLQLPLFE